MPKRRASRHPLAAGVYLSRNASKSLPLMGVIILAVMLVAGIIAMINSITLSIRVIYHYSIYFAAITPRGDAELTPKLRERIENESPVELDRLVVCRGSETVVKSIVGKWPFSVLALRDSDLRYYLRRMNIRQIDGRLPNPAAAEAVISEPVARNLGLKLGSTFLGPDKTDAYSPKRVKVVGIARTDEWIALASFDYYAENHYPPIDILLAFAKDRSEQKTFDLWAKKEMSKERARVFTFAELDKDTNEMFKILYKILNVIIGTLVVVITTMMGMLINIYLIQRIQEFGLLQALGYTKAELLRRVGLESLLVTLGGWVLGMVAAWTLLTLVDRILMHPQAFALNTLDPLAYLYTVPAPFAILGVAFGTVWFRFRKFDPVGVVERRLV